MMADCIQIKIIFSDMSGYKASLIFSSSSQKYPCPFVLILNPVHIELKIEFVSYNSIMVDCGSW